MTLQRGGGMSTYRDVEPIMRRALYGGMNLRIECGTPAKAVRMVQRMNQCRIRDRQLNWAEELKKDLPPDVSATDGNETQFMARVRAEESRRRMDAFSSLYDHLIFRRNDTLVIVEHRPQREYIEIRDEHGNLINIGEHGDYEPQIPAAEPHVERDASHDFGAGGLGLETDEN